MHPIILQLGNRVYRRNICDRDQLPYALLDNGAG